jgi:hypothetical protein
MEVNFSLIHDDGTSIDQAPALGGCPSHRSNSAAFVAQRTSARGRGGTKPLAR